MSSSLYWRPPIEPRPLGHQLKFAISQKLWGHDGSLTSEWTLVESSLIPFLEGVAAAGCEETRSEAKFLIKIIRDHGEAEIRLAN